MLVCSITAMECAGKSLPLSAARCKNCFSIEKNYCDTWCVPVGYHREKKAAGVLKMKCPPLCMDISFFKPPRPPTPSEHILHLVSRLATTTLKHLVPTPSENGLPFRI
jgi:hypothetical protein